MPSKSSDDAAVTLWGNVLCQQLALPILNWQREQRDKYSFYREIVTPSVFAQPNPAAFQNLMHFLFTVLNAAEANEKFLGLWPLYPGDKKAESQFRLAYGGILPTCLLVESPSRVTDYWLDGFLRLLVC